MPAARVYWWETGGSDPGGGQAREAAQKDVNGHSVGVAKASLYLFGCFCYNCCCCCCCRGWCGEDFYWPSWICYEIELGRDRWLWGLHLVCFCIHTAWAVAAYTGGMDSDMLVTIYRVKPSWQNRGGAYAYEVVPLDDDKQFLHIHVVTALFFGFSACMHGIWVFIGPWSKRLLWDKLDDCLCLWRAARSIERGARARAVARWLPTPPSLGAQALVRVQPLRVAHVGRHRRRDRHPRSEHARRNRIPLLLDHVVRLLHGAALEAGAAGGRLSEVGGGPRPSEEAKGGRPARIRAVRVQEGVALLRPGAPEELRGAHVPSRDGVLPLHHGMGDHPEQLAGADRRPVPRRTRPDPRLGASGHLRKLDDLLAVHVRAVAVRAHPRAASHTPLTPPHASQVPVDCPRALLAFGGVVLHPIGARPRGPWCTWHGRVHHAAPGVCAQATSKVYLGWILYVNVIAKASFNEAVSRAGGNFTAVNLTEWC